MKSILPKSLIQRIKELCRAEREKIIEDAVDLKGLNSQEKFAVPFNDYLKKRSV